jgi:hypothetical protein
VITFRTARALVAAAALGLLALAVPQLALGHTGSATVSCTGADFSFSSFQAGSNTVHYVVTVDQSPVAQGDFTLDQAGGQAGSLHVPLSISGTHTVAANAWWGPAGTVGGETRPAGSPPLASQVLACHEATPVTTPAPTAPAPAAAQPAPAPAAAQPAPAPAQTPATAVQGNREVSPARVARLSTASVCASRHVRVTVTGRSMRQVTVSLVGHRPRTVTVRPGQRTVRVSLRMPSGTRTPIVLARVRFSNGARPLRLTTSARRCSPAVVQPQFTG